jgi:hypothetical protein
VRYLEAGSLEVWIEEEVLLCPDCRFIIEGNISGFMEREILELVGPPKYGADGEWSGYARAEN